MGKPIITDVVLEKLVLLAKDNARLNFLEKTNPAYFYQIREDSQRTYLCDTKPVLEPYAKHYEPIRIQMRAREDIYQRQVLAS